MMMINDDAMYDYFEKLLADPEHGLREEWKCGSDMVPYGLTDYDVRSMLGSKQLLYGKEDGYKQICLLETMQRFLHDHVGIDGLEEMLINNYGAIENGIFFEHDDQGRPANIREHAKHQMKNAYLGSVLLLEYGYLRNMAEMVLQGRSGVTRYLCYQAEEALRSEKEGGAGDRPRKRGEEGTREKIGRGMLLSKLEEWCYKIYMVSALLHDIGYPLEYYLRAARKLADYPPYLKLLSPTVKLPYAEMKALLSASQLFRMVDQDEIRKKYERDDHGALSAVSLLMHFYYGGRIYSMSAGQRCIIEMSAMAIYHHTDRFKEEERMVYLTDPISFMVRLCDDLQEWNRFKIMLNEKRGLFRCPRCGKLFLEQNGIYGCACPKGTGFRKVTAIKSRKVDYVSLCDGLRLEKEAGRVRIIFDFSLIRQIEILMEDYTAVLGREKGLRAVKEMLEDQYLSPEMEIVFFLSNNPLSLIEEIIRRSGRSEEDIRKWIGRQKPDRLRSNLQEFYEDYLVKKEEGAFGGRLEKDRLRYGEEVCAYVRRYYGEMHYLAEASAVKREPE